ncbi:hypothetical protein L916_10952, partial [Phytophthora nicotianae]
NAFKKLALDSMFLPLEEDSLLFHLCLYYGALVLLLELLVPLLLHRRVRIEIPRLPLRAPVVPLSTREFQQRRLALRQQVAALQRDIAETPRRSPQKRRQVSSTSAAKQRSAASSTLSSPTFSVKMRPKSPRETSGVKRKSNRNQEQGKDAPAEPTRPMPMAMSDFLVTSAPRRGGFSFDEIRDEVLVEENRKEKEDWVNARIARRRESSTFSGRRPVRLVEDVESVGYNGPSEAATRLEALIGARRRRRESAPPPHIPAPPPVPAMNHSPAPVSAPVAPAASLENHLELSVSQAPKPVQQEASLLVRPQNEQKTTQDEETKESERNEPVADFQAFCASFAVGGSAAALQAAAKRKHHEAFGSDTEQTSGGVGIAEEFVEMRKYPRVSEQITEESESSAPSATLQVLDKRSHYKALGSENENEIDDAEEVQQIFEKRNHDQAFGEQERPQETTPRIIRRISFGDEADALTASPKEVPSERSTGKRKHKQAFGMLDDEDEDAEWRDSLAFRPHRMD